MDCNVEKVRKELVDDPVGPNEECPFYPCHHEGQDCTFCYCPFYPCNDTEVGGRTVISRKGEPVWSCKGCHFFHTVEVSGYVHSKLRDKEFPDGADLDTLFADIKERFFYPEIERWSRF